MEWSVKEAKWSFPNGAGKMEYKYIGLAYGNTHAEAKVDAQKRYPGKWLRLELNRQN